MTGDICGQPTETTDQPCQHPVNACPVHDGNGDQGRPSEFDEETAEAIYAAVGSGLNVGHVAAAAGVSASTLRRWTCCVDNLAECELTADDPCEFCKGYVRAHADGAREVLEDCRPEFRASASYGYTKTEERDLNHSGLTVSPEFVDTDDE
jgi:hypothetical protein